MGFFVSVYISDYVRINKIFCFFHNLLNALGYIFDSFLVKKSEKIHENKKVILILQLAVQNLKLVVLISVDMYVSTAKGFI